MEIADFLNRAIAIAAEAHAGQLDKGGQPYILHPLRVMMRMSSTQEMVVAVLHDVLEDCPEWSGHRLSSEGLTDGHALEALDYLTRRKGQPYQDYILRMRACDLAKKVKLADLADNLDRNRPSTTQLASDLVDRYEQAITLLTMPDADGTLSS